MALLDLLGRRWALRTIWELRDSALSFRELQSACGGISSSVLSQRVAELRHAGIVEPSDGGGFRLSPEGEKLMEAYGPLAAWAERWAMRSGSRPRAKGD
jgi:DNA-binding HxlR family transcriptional regulator